MSCCCISLLGWATVLYLFYRLLKFVRDVLYPFLIATPIDDLVTYAGADWAVVTGSTDGIGKEYAIQLAQKGFNVALVARNIEKLNNVAKEIASVNNKIEIRVIVFDFTEDSPDAYREKIGDKLNDVKVGVLVNNVGMGMIHADYFCEDPGGVKGMRDMVVVNCMSVTMMSHLFLPQMLSRSQGVVINVSSASALIPMGLLSIYSATKAFVSFVTNGIQQEYKDTGVFIQTVTPFYVISKLSGLKQPSTFVLTAEHYVNNALGTVGIQRTTCGCLPHAIQGTLFDILPSCLIQKITYKVLNAVRIRAHKRKSSEKTE